MTTTLSEGVKVPDVGSTNWAGDLEVNWNLLNGALANLSGNVKLDRDNTWTGEQSFTLPIVGSITGTAAKAIADEDGTSIKTGYGKLAGNNTWTGSNTFNGIKSTGVVRVEKSTGDTEFEIVNGEVDATTNTLSRQDDIRFYDKNTKITGGLRLTYTTDTGTKIELYARSWKADGTASYNRSLTIYTNGQTGEYYTTLETNFLPKNTSVYSLGSSSYQWASVYAQTYYYNGTAWGLDKANTWTGVNTFSIATAESVAVKHTTYKGAILFRTNGVSNFKNYNTFLKWDINGYDNSFGLYRSVGVLGDTTTGATDEDIDTSFSLWKAHIRSKSLDFTDSVKVTNDGTENSLKPITNNVTDLGTSTNKWKTLNGVNPGALSLPDSANAITIDTTNWVTNTPTNNAYTPSKDGWLSVVGSHASSANFSVYIKSGDFYVSSYSALGDIDDNINKLGVFVPVLTGHTYYIVFKGNLTLTVNATFYPCLGNV